MYIEEITQGVAHQLGQLTSEFVGWRFGRGGSGQWWAVRRNDFLRAPTADELRARMLEHASTHRE